MKLNTKFSLTIGLFTIFSAGLSIFLVFSFMGALSLRAYQLQASSAITEWLKLRVYLSDLFSISFDTDNVQKSWQQHRTDVADKFEIFTETRQNAAFSSKTKEFYKNISGLFNLIDPLLGDLNETLSNVNSGDYTNSIRQSLNASGINYVLLSRSDDNSGEVAILYLRLNSAISKMNTYSDVFQSALDRFQDSLSADVSRKIYWITIQSFVLLAIGSILIFVVINLITSRITKRLRFISNETERLSSKDFTRAFSDRATDEIGQLTTHLGATVASLNGVLSTIKDGTVDATDMSESINFSAGEVTAATTEINANVGSMQKQFDNLRSAVRSATEALESMSSFLVNFVTDINAQSSSIGESTVSIAEMNQSIMVISKKGQEKLSQITEIKKVATDGEEKIANTESILTGVTTELDNVSSFIEMINSIAEQTSILSMNAAIESAHAGEAGKGFAVVADEIQKLAESTTENAQLITTTLTDIVSNVQEARNSSQIATQAFTDTSEAIGELIETLNEIVSAIHSVDEKSELLASHSAEVSESTKKLSARTGKLDDLRKTAISNITSMESVFTEASGGIKEINIGTEDILAKIRQIHDLSSQSKDKMEILRSMLDEFQTIDPTKLAVDENEREIDETNEVEEALESAPEVD